MMANPAATREEVNQTAARAGMLLSTPGLDKRFNRRLVSFLDSLLAEAVQQLVHTAAPAASLLTRFHGVDVGDSTRIELPKALAGVFSRDREQASAAAKVAVQWELGQGGLRLWLSDATVHDQRTGIGAQPLPAGGLRLNDLGFFNLERFAQESAEGIYFFSRYKVGTQVYTAEGKPLDLRRTLRRQRGQAGALPIQWGACHLPCRLIALPVSPEQVGKRRQRLRRTARRKQQPLSQRCLDLAAWTVYVTNIPPEQLTVEEAPILGATRWQIELL
jgi:hypothetical protein